MKNYSLFYISCLLVAIQIPVCHSEGFFGKLVRFATGGGDNGGKRKTKKKRLPFGNPNHSYPHDYPTAKLSNGVLFPLVGVGVGNMNPHLVPAIIYHGLHDDKDIRLVDTAHVSQNEFLVSMGIIEGASKLAGDAGDDPMDPIEFHVTSKVWYTHLGYDRTILAVKDMIESLQEAIDHPKVDLKLHVLLHWPRCYDEIPWMDCSGEEANLPAEVQKVGKPPHLDPENAWKQSWKALEDLLADSSNPVASIGVSNFHRKELEELISVAKVTPHLVELDMWSLLYDPLLIEFCHKNDIHIIAYHLMQTILSKFTTAPFATHHLLSVANDITKEMRSSGSLGEDDKDITAAQVILTWLVQHSISVIPRTTDLVHLKENSASALVEIPPMDDSRVQIVAQSVEALISGEDLTEDAFVTLTFHAKSKDVFLYWHDPAFGGEIEVAKIEKGSTYEESSHPGHQFRIYYGDKESGSHKGSQMDVFTVSGNYGEHRHIEL